MNSPVLFLALFLSFGVWVSFFTDAILAWETLELLEHFCDEIVDFLLFPILPAVAGRGHAEGTLKNFGKVIYVQNAHLLCYLGDGAVGGGQLLGGTLDPLGVDIIDQGAAGLLLEQGGKIGRADVSQRRKAFEGVRLRKV